MAKEDGIIIAGGGPVGLIVGLILGRAGVEVTLFDKGDILHQQPRAATIHPASLDILDELRVYERVEPLGLVCPIVNYYDQQELLASFDHAILAGETRHPCGRAPPSLGPAMRAGQGVARSVRDVARRTEPGHPDRDGGARMLAVG